MTLLFRALLIFSSLGTIVYFLLKIRRSKVQIQDTIFWFFFSMMLLILSLVPGIMVLFAQFLGVQSAANLLFLVVTFVLLMRIFHLTLRVSMLESKLNHLGQALALHEMKRTDESEEAPTGSGADRSQAEEGGEGG